MQVYFLFKPNLVVLHGFSACAHFVLLLVMSVAWVCNRLKVNSHECTEQRLKDNAKFLLYIPTLLSCLGMSLFHLILSVLNYFYWYRDGWSESSENYLAIQFDLVLRTLAWFVVCGYLRACLSYSSEKKYPIFPRIWWGFYFLLSCSCLALDIVLYTQHKCYLPTHFWVLDIGSVLPGSFLCYIGLFGGRNRENTIPLQEPLLNGVGGSSNGNGIRNVSPYSSAGLLSLLTFSWISPLISLGNKKTLDPNDLPEIAEIGSANRIFPIFINKLESYCGSDNESNGVGSLLLLKALILSMWKEILYSAFFALVNTISSYVGPYLMETFIQYLHDRGNSTLKGCLLVSVFLVAKLVECLSQGQLHFWADRFGMQGHTALVALIYKKLLSLSSRAKQDYTSGEIVNLMSVDTERIGEFSWYAIRLCLVPFQIGVAMFILYRSMGPASFITLAAAMTIMVGNIPVGRLQQKFQLGMMEAKDERMKSTAEILRNMRVLKLQAWEMRFLSQIYELRKKEENLLRKYLYTSVVEVFLFCGVPAFMAAISFLSCIPLGIPLTSGRILSALATFRYLQVPIDELPAIITMFAQMKISLNRIVSFLCLEDLHPDILEKLPRGSSKVSVEIINGNFSWDLSYANPTLRNLNLRVYNGMKVAICGTVGSGKSSLLSCILGEVPRLSGTVTLAGSKVYVSQSSWIQGGTIEYNILFGKEMDREKYEQVLEVCSLKSDIEVLDFGDQTIIGERGINPSGGQKQRIQIARALYQDADIYLFDDPFSAVDAYTGTHLFKRCLLGLLGSKTVIYVTHQVEFLPYADLILLMNDGMITQAGKYDDILISGSDFVELISAHEKALRAIDSTKSTCPNQVENEENLHYFVENCKKGKLRKDGVNSEFDEIVVPKVQFVQEEDGGKGKVGMSIYWTYITTSYRGALIPCILLAQILFQFLQIGSTYWVAGTFPASEDKRTPTGGLFLIQYVALALGSSVCILVADLLQAISGYKTATLLFKKMHNCVFRAPMSFFDSTSSACILNRASIDQSEVDESIPNLIKWFAFSTIQLLGTVIMMSQVYWHVFIIFVLMISISIWYQQYCIATIKELSRMVGVRNADIIQHFTETASGSTTIRSFDQESRFMETKSQAN
uniref:ABC transporter C family member 3-like n=1 Tax=Nelumbo nucifera TaxID=4432 RepID=A0A822ZNC5_NELNU|nr:TPA_asm: hypothetical protein HUJ06_003099 [Nelumbo nucifera]